jgi:hypothetical protein
MGIDIYARWDGQTKEEEQAQITGFSVVSGHVGYLREAYHGEPYATKFLLREAFESKPPAARIPAEVLEERLPRTLELVEERERTIYEETDEAAIERVKQSYRDFVALCAEKEKETGWPTLIHASY